MSQNKTEWKKPDTEDNTHTRQCECIYAKVKWAEPAIYGGGNQEGPYLGVKKDTRQVSRVLIVCTDSQGCGVLRSVHFIESHQAAHT